jgi:hypothetical protein
VQPDLWHSKIVRLFKLVDGKSFGEDATISGRKNDNPKGKNLH